MNDPKRTTEPQLSMAKSPEDPTASPTTPADAGGDSIQAFSSGSSGGSPHESRAQLPMIYGSRSAAEVEVAQQIVDLVESNPCAVLGVATGGTMKGVYRELAARAGGLDLSRIKAFSLDEFLGLEPGHPRSFRAFLERHFVGPLGLGPEQLVTPDDRLAAKDPKAAATAYEDQIAGAGGIDLQLLGIGRNGHVAFNEPGSLAASRTRVIELDEVTRADAVTDFGSLNAVPTHAITVGIATIFEAKRLRLLAFGEGKQAAVARVLQGPVGGDVPATFLASHGGLELHLDRSAAGMS